jgi:hypothetical protein
MSFDRAAHCRAIGSKGGRATVDKHGVVWMSVIGKRGFKAMVEHSGYSDYGHAISHFIEKGIFVKKGGRT